MKKMISTVSVLVIFSSFSIAHAKSWKDDWLVNGVDINEITYKDIVGFGLGMITSSFVHWLGHTVYFEANGIDWHQQGNLEYVDEPMSDYDVAMSGRAGFIVQLLVGTVLRYTSVYGTAFGFGYNIKTAFDIITYPIFYNNAEKYGDLICISYDGNRDVEYFIYSGYSIWLLSKKEK